MTKLGKFLLTILVSLCAVFVLAPAQAVPNGFDINNSYGHISGSITFTGTKSFTADVDVSNNASCFHHTTAAMFKLTFTDGASARFTRHLDDPLGCNTGPVQYRNEKFSATDHPINHVTARICQIISGQFENCQLEAYYFDNPNT